MTAPEQESSLFATPRQSLGSKNTSDSWQQNSHLEYLSAEEILHWSLENFGEGLSIGTAFGTSGMVLIDMAVRINPDIDIFYVDTGYFFPETLALIGRAQHHYNRPFRQVTSDLSVVEQGQIYGPTLYRDNSDQCCHIRKVTPMEKALQNSIAWMSALRRDQAPTRANTPVVRWAEKYGVVKVAPLVHWSEEDVWAYIRQHDVPYNDLHDQNYPSIGCWPCTRSVQPGDDLRAGRWAGMAKSECGLHWAQGQAI